MKLKNKDFKILIGGGTGYIGNHLKQSLKMKYPTSNILSISRSQGKDNITWEELESKGIPDDCIAIYNFVGRNMMSGLWTNGEKEQLMDSRIKPTKILSKLINNRSSSSQLELFCCASGTSYSFDREKTFTEDDKFDENIFPGKLCTKWEEAANEVKDDKVRVINARLGVVLSEDGGILQRMSLPFKFYLGSTLGDGQQYFPWIHLADVIEILNRFLEDEKMRGPFNLVSPQLVTNYTFTQELASALNRKVFLSANRWMLSTILGEASCMVLEGCKIEPQRLKEFNYEYKYPDLKLALQNIYSKL